MRVAKSVETIRQGFTESAVSTVFNIDENSVLQSKGPLLLGYISVKNQFAGRILYYFK